MTTMSGISSRTSLLTKREVAACIRAVQDILRDQFSLSLPQRLLPRGAWDKVKLRLACRETKRHVDTRLRPILLRKCGAVGLTYGQAGGEAWEQLSLKLAKALFGDALVHTQLPNNRRPDIVPCLDGIRLEQQAGRAPKLLYAPLVIEVKHSALHAAVGPKYGRYAGRVELWLYRWRPHWRIHREARVTYQSPIELARRVERIGDRSLASVLRDLPLLWRNYELLPHYSRGIT